jgi:flavodoxin
MSDRFWNHAGISEIKDKNGSKRVRIPDRIFRDEDVVELGKPIYWHYHTDEKFIVIAKEELEGDEYEMIRYSKFSEGDSEYLCTIPKIFFEGFEGKGSPKVKPEVAEEMELHKKGFLHFIYHDGMVESDPESCYVLTDAQFSERFEDSGLWDGKLSEVPKFG